MSAKAEALAAMNRALSLFPKDGVMTPLDTSLVRSALLHAEACVGRIEELRRKRSVRKKATGAADA